MSVANAHAAILAHVERVKSSAPSMTRQRLRDLLDYLVAEELEGRGDQISGNSIAFDVLGRGAEFDPSTDSIVRVEMSRLRAALQQYYDLDDADRTVRVVIPRGKYRPEFKFAAKRAPMLGPGKRLLAGAGVLAATLLCIAAGAAFYFDWLAPAGKSPDEYLGFKLPAIEGPRVAVYPMKPSGDNKGLEVLAYGLSTDTVTEISRFRWFSVFFSAQAGSAPAGAAARRAADYELRGEVQVDDTLLRVNVRLTDGETGQVLWADIYSRPLNASNMIEIQQAVALEIAITVGRRSGGGVATLEERRVVRDTTLSTTAYACVLRTYHYWRTFLPEEHFKVRACLEKSVPRHDGYAEGHAALDFMYLDEHRYGTNARRGYVPLERAREHAARAFKLNPFSTLAAQALFTCHSQVGDKEAFRRTGQTALRNAPSNPELLADFGNKLALRIGEWRVGTELALRAIELNPDAPGTYFISPAFNAYRLGKYDEAIDWSDKMNMPDFFQYQVLRLAAFQRLGAREKVRFHLGELARLGYTRLDDILRFTHASSMDIDLSEQLGADISAAFDGVSG